MHVIAGSEEGFEERWSRVRRGIAGREFALEALQVPISETLPGLLDRQSPKRRKSGKCVHHVSLSKNSIGHF